MIVRMRDGAPYFDYEGYRKAIGVNAPVPRAGAVATLPIEEWARALPYYPFSEPGDVLNSILELAYLGLLIANVEYDAASLAYRGWLVVA